MKPSVLALALALVPAVGAAQAGSQLSYGKQVSTGQVTLEIEPQWQDTALVVTVRLKVKEGDLGKMGISLQDNMMLTADRKTYAPASSGGRLEGRQSVLWVAFKLEKKPTSFALSVCDVPDVPVRILRFTEPALTPDR
ncbi:MAG TPA: hypothetical protein VNL18_04540 [Gemmatimonadales bacterium]|nr:hypothetical protein [Gemmatimonadales bacterium]